MRLRLILTFAALLVLAGAAHAQQPVVIFGVEFPDRIAGAQRGAPHDFETERPGLGHSVAYEAPGWKIDIYIYDLRRRDIADDPQSEPVKGQLAQASGDIVKTYGQAETRLKYAILDDAARVRFLCASFAFTDREGPRDSYLCVTAARGKFVKFRLTTARRPGSESAANNFVQAWTKVLWPD